MVGGEARPDNLWSGRVIQLEDTRRKRIRCSITQGSVNWRVGSSGKIRCSRVILFPLVLTACFEIVEVQSSRNCIFKPAFLPSPHTQTYSQNIRVFIFVHRSLALATFNLDHLWHCISTPVRVLFALGPGSESDKRSSRGALRVAGGRRWRRGWEGRLQKECGREGESHVRRCLTWAWSIDYRGMRLTEDAGGLGRRKGPKGASP